MSSSMGSISEIRMDFNDDSSRSKIYHLSSIYFMVISHQVLTINSHTHS